MATPESDRSNAVTNERQDGAGAAQSIDRRSQIEIGDPVERPVMAEVSRHLATCYQELPYHFGPEEEMINKKRMT